MNGFSLHIEPPLVEADQALVFLTFDSITWIQECNRLVAI